VLATKAGDCHRSLLGVSPRGSAPPLADASPGSDDVRQAPDSYGRSMADAPDTLYVLAASYDNADDAVADYELIKALYYEVKASEDFDAAVIAKDDKGNVEIVKKHEQPTRHEAAHGARWGLAAGAVAALFPPVGIAAAL